jgi:hypothetical protein
MLVANNMLTKLRICQVREPKNPKAVPWHPTILGGDRRK